MVVVLVLCILLGLYMGHRRRRAQRADVSAAAVVSPRPVRRGGW